MDEMIDSGPSEIVVPYSAVPKTDSGDKSFAICSAQHYLLLEMLQRKGLISYEDIATFLKECVRPLHEGDVHVSLKTGKTIEVPT